jgi:hypothetical protein
MRIFGGGFQRREQINIVDQNSQLLTSAIAFQFGNYEATNGFLKTFPPTQHTAQAFGQTSGRTSNIAGFFVCTVYIALPRFPRVRLVRYC